NGRVSHWRFAGFANSPHTLRMSTPTERADHSPSSDLARAEASVEAHSASLKKELGVPDLVLTQILFIVGLSWIGVAGKLGPPHVVLRLLPIVLCYLPLHVV